MEQTKSSLFVRLGRHVVTVMRLMCNTCTWRQPGKYGLFVGFFLELRSFKIPTNVPP